MDKTILAHSGRIDKVREEPVYRLAFVHGSGRLTEPMVKRISEDADRLAARSV